MRKFISIITIVSAILVLWSCRNNKYTPEKPENHEILAESPDNREVLAETDSVQILQEIVEVDPNGVDAPISRLWIRNRSDSIERVLLTTVKLTGASWYVADAERFIEVPIDSITAVHRVYIFNEKPLQLIVQGCPDQRNEYSYFIDVDKKKAWYVPANSGYVGGTEEGYMIFRSYRYVSAPDIGGRYTFLQIFDEDGVMVDSLNLEHVQLDKYR